MKSKVYFGIIFLITLAIAATHQSDFPRFLLGFELLLLVSLLLHIRQIRRHVRATLRIPDTFGRKKGDLRVEVELENTGRFPVPEIRLEIGYQDRYSKKTGRLSGVAMLDGKGKAILCFHLTSDYCGAIAFQLEKVTVSDYLGIFQGKCQQNGEIQEISVLPDREKKLPQMDAQSQMLSETGNEFELHRPGDDPSETYNIREFRQGDTMHRIHWKMMAKTDQMLVRDFSQPVENTTLLLLDLKEKKEISREEWDHFLETAASLSDRLVRLGYVHYAAWLDAGTGEVVRMCVGSEEELQVMLSALVRASVYQTGEIRTCYKENYADETLSEIIRIDLEGKIIREGKEN